MLELPLLEDQLLARTVLVEHTQPLELPPVQPALTVALNVLQPPLVNNVTLDSVSLDPLALNVLLTLPQLEEPLPVSLVHQALSPPQELPLVILAQVDVLLVLQPQAARPVLQDLVFQDQVVLNAQLELPQLVEPTLVLPAQPELSLLLELPLVILALTDVPNVQAQLHAQAVPQDSVSQDQAVPNVLLDKPQLEVLLLVPHVRLALSLCLELAAALLALLLVQLVLLKLLARPALQDSVSLEALVLNALLVSPPMEEPLLVLPAQLALSQLLVLLLVPLALLPVPNVLQLHPVKLAQPALVSLDQPVLNVLLVNLQLEDHLPVPHVLTEPSPLLEHHHVLLAQLAVPLVLPPLFAKLALLDSV